MCPQQLPDGTQNGLYILYSPFQFIKKVQFLVIYVSFNIKRRTTYPRCKAKRFVLGSSPFFKSAGRRRHSSVSGFFGTQNGLYKMYSPLLLFVGYERFRSYQSFFFLPTAMPAAKPPPSATTPAAIAATSPPPLNVDAVS